MFQPVNVATRRPGARWTAVVILASVLFAGSVRAEDQAPAPVAPPAPAPVVTPAPAPAPTGADPATPPATPAPAPKPDAPDAPDAPVGADKDKPDIMAAMRAQMGGPVDETTYAAVLKLHAAVKPLDEKIKAAKDDAAKAPLLKDREKAFTDAKIAEAAYNKFYMQMQNINLLLMSKAMSPDKEDQAKADSTLKMFEPVSVTTVTAHHKAPADAKPAALPAAVEADAAKLAGTWELDFVTTLEVMNPGMSDEAKAMMAELMASRPHPSRIVLAADGKADSYLTDEDGAEVKEAGTWSYADKKLTLKKPDQPEGDEVMGCSLRGPWLLLGQDRMQVVLKKKE